MGVHVQSGLVSQGNANRRKPPKGVRASAAAWSKLSAKLEKTSGNIIFKGDSNAAPFTGADNSDFLSTWALQLERAIMSSKVLGSNYGPYNVVVIPTCPDTASSNVTNSPAFESTQLQTFGMVKVIGPESPENSNMGSPTQGWIQPRTPGSDNATAGTGYCAELRLNVRSGDSTARHFSRNTKKFAICYELRRSSTVSISSGNQAGYDDSNATIAGGVTYGSNVNQAESINVTGEITANGSAYGASPTGVFFNGGNMDTAYTGGGQDHVGPVWSQWFLGANPGNKDYVIRIKVPTGSAIRIFAIAIATDNASGKDRSNADPSTPAWSFWNLSRSGGAGRHYSPTYDANGAVTAAALYRRWFGAVENFWGTPKVSGSALPGATSVPVLYAAGADILLDANMVNDYTSHLSTVANIKSYYKNIANAANALGMVMIKILPPCSSNGAASIALKNAWATNYALIQTAMRELVKECPNFILVDTWEALGNPLPCDQFFVHRLHPGFVINNANSYTFDGQHFTQNFRDMATGLLVSALKYAKE